MHNFPKNISIACTKIHTFKEGKEILHLTIDNDCKIAEVIFNQIIDKNYPRLLWNGKNLDLTYVDTNYKEYIWVSFEEFKAFLQGKGKYKIPYKEELVLNNDYRAFITKDKIEVGCQSFTHEIVKKLYLASQKAQKS